MKRVNRTGEVYHRLTIVSDDRLPGTDRVPCRCVCGAEVYVSIAHLRSGHTTSCGCKNAENFVRGLRYKHGGKDTAEYRIWKGIKARCLNPERRSYTIYGERGITMCSEWQSDFAAFLLDLGPRPSPSHSVERLDNERGYEPGNCSWVLRKVQANNTRRNLWFTITEETHTLAQWCELYHMPYARVYSRITAGWPIQEALTYPISPGRRKVTC